MPSGKVNGGEKSVGECRMKDSPQRASPPRHSARKFTTAANLAVRRSGRVSESDTRKSENWGCRMCRIPPFGDLRYAISRQRSASRLPAPRADGSMWALSVRGSVRSSAAMDHKRRRVGQRFLMSASGPFSEERHRVVAHVRDPPIAGITSITVATTKRRGTGRPRRPSSRPRRAPRGHARDARRSTRGFSGARSRGGGS